MRINKNQAACNFVCLNSISHSACHTNSPQKQHHTEMLKKARAELAKKTQSFTQLREHVERMNGKSSYLAVLSICSSFT